MKNKSTASNASIKQQQPTEKAGKDLGSKQSSNSSSTFADKKAQAPLSQSGQAVKSKNK